MNLKILPLFTLVLVLIGCQMSQIQSDDLSPVDFAGTRDKPATVIVVTGEAHHGISPSKVFFVGSTATVVPSAGNPNWAFGAQDQIEFGRHFAQELERNGTFPSVVFDKTIEDGYTVTIKFKRTIQYRDVSQYDFHLAMEIVSEGETQFDKDYVVEGEYGLKDFLIETTTRAGKAREASKLMSILMGDIQTWLQQSDSN